MATREYHMRVTAHDRDVLERLYRIMNCEDPEYYIYTVIDVNMKGPFEDNGLYYADYIGDVVWGVDIWFMNEEEPRDIIESTCAHYISLDILSEKLGFAAEAYCRESGRGFFEHYTCVKGNTINTESCDYHDLYIKDEEDLECLKNEYKEIYGEPLNRQIENQILANMKMGANFFCKIGGFDNCFTPPKEAIKGIFAAGALSESEFRIDD